MTAFSCCTKPACPEEAGVKHTSTPVFLLQARAKNEATFRVEDQGGWQPDHVPIDAQQTLNSYLCTDLPVSTIAGDSLLWPPTSDSAPAAERLQQKDCFAMDKLCRSPARGSELLMRIRGLCQFVPRACCPCGLLCLCSGSRTPGGSASCNFRGRRPLCVQLYILQVSPAEPAQQQAEVACRVHPCAALRNH